MVIAAEPAPFLLHQGLQQEHEVELASVDLASADRALVTIRVTNRRTGDTFDRSWNAAACAQEMPLTTTSSEPAAVNFHRVVQAALHCVASGSGSTSELGGTILTARSFEEGTELSARDDQKFFMLTIHLKIGDGILALRHDINLKVPLVFRATELQRHQVSSQVEIQGMRQAMEDDQAAAELNLLAERSQHRRSLAAVLGCVSIIAIAIATLALSEEQVHGDDGSMHNLTAGCFMSDLRHLNELVVLKPTVASRVVEVVMTAFGALLLRYGWRLLPAVFFFSGFVGGAALCFMFTWSLFHHVQWFDCSVLTGVTICGGLLGGFLARVGKTAAFAVLGSLTGTVLGYYTYILALGRLTTGPLVFWISIATPAVLGGGVVLRRKDAAVPATSSVIGSCMVVVSLTLMFLPPDASQWLKLRHGLLHPDLEPVGDWFHVLGPVMLALFLAARGTSAQLHDQEEKSPESAPILRDPEAAQGYGTCVPVQAIPAVSVAERQPLMATAPVPDV